jgi:pseudaminic acid cytidylyltransferase
MTKRLAVIPARGGSKRIPKKNIRNFCGKPIIAYILDTVKKSNIFDVIHVSTDSESIANTVHELGFTVDFMRPSELADDYTPVMPVLKYVHDEYLNRGYEFDQVWSLMPTSPFIEAEDLIKADKLFIKSGCNYSLWGVSEYQAPVEWAFEREDDGSLVPVQPGKFAIRSQDLEPKYYDVGSFALFSSKTVVESEGAGSDDKYIGYVLPKYKAVDIDTMDDWMFAEMIYKGYMCK